MKHKIAVFFSLVFLAFLLTEFGFFVNGVRKSDKTFGKEAVSDYFSCVRGRDVIIARYGKIQKILGKRSFEDFSMFLTDYGKLVVPRSLLSEETIRNKVSELKPITDLLDAQGIPCLYLGSLLPIQSTRDLPLGAKDYSRENAEVLHRLVKEELKVPMLSLNEILPDMLKKEDLFYRTDHHWSGDASFAAYQVILERLIDAGVLPRDTQRLQFERKVTEQSFLGSYGIKIGPEYVGKEDYVYYCPAYSPKMEFVIQDPAGNELRSIEGSWEDALVNRTILEDPTYNNKYNATLYGHTGISRVLNPEKPSGRKLLVLGHSYARPLVQYLSLHFSEVRQVDPQAGRFSGNYLTYIKEYQPDMVLVLCEWEGEILGSFKTE